MRALFCKLGDWPCSFAAGQSTDTADISTFESNLFRFAYIRADAWAVMLTYRGFKIERVIMHSNAGRLHLRPSGTLGIRPAQVTKYAILERTIGNHWVEIGAAEDDGAAILLIDQILRSRTDKASGDRPSAA